AERTAADLAEAGVPAELADCVCRLDRLVPALDLVELASATGLAFDEAARTYFAIGERLGLHSLRDRISALPREERWDSLARRALWEDLQSEHRALTADVLQESENGPVAERVSSWIAHNAGAVDRCAEVLADVKAGDASDLA